MKKFALAIFCIFWIQGCVVSKANIQSIEKTDRPKKGEAIVFFSAGLKTQSNNGIGSSLTLNFSESTRTQGPDHNGLYKIEIMPNDVGLNDFDDDGNSNLYVLKLPVGSYMFDNFTLANDNWVLRPKTNFNIPFYIKENRVFYAGYIKVSLSKKKTKSRIEQLDRYERDVELLKKKMGNLDIEKITRYNSL